MKLIYPLLISLLLTGCTSEVRTKTTREGFPSEVYINTCGNIDKHFTWEADKNNDLWFTGESDVFSKLKVDPGKDGSVAQMTYFLKRGERQKVLRYLHDEYNRELRANDVSEQLLFKDVGDFMRFDLTEDKFDVYVSAH